MAEYPLSHYEVESPDKKGPTEEPENSEFW